MEPGIAVVLDNFISQLLNSKLFNYLLFFYGGLMTGFFIMILFAYVYDKEYHRKRRISTRKEKKKHGYNSK